MGVSLRGIRNAVGIMLVALVSGAGGYWWGTREVKLALDKQLKLEVINRLAPDQYQNVDFSLFWEVWAKLENEYLDSDKIKPDQMVYGAISGMTASLQDPYTVFLPPTQNQQAKEDLNGEFGGVGIQLGYIKRQLAVMAPLEGHPAKQAGVRAGDLIIHIKDADKGVDQDTGGLSLPEAVTLIRGKKGTKVTLTLVHEKEEQPVEIEMVRDTITIPSVEVEFGKMANGKWQIDKDKGSIAWLKLHRFGENTDSEWLKAMEEIVAQRNKIKDSAGVILDLRDNPGGYLAGSVFVGSEFIKDGVIVQQQGKTATETFSVNRRGKLIDVPVVVLVNKGSASASEITAGALRDRLGVKLVGEKTFGKGTVQTAEDLRNGAGIHITVTRWLLPGGSRIPDDGLEPAVAVEDDKETTDRDEQLEKAVEVLMQ